MNAKQEMKMNQVQTPYLCDFLTWKSAYIVLILSQTDKYYNICVQRKILGDLCAEDVSYQVYTDRLHVTLL